MWWLVWVLLGLGALATFALLGLRLWRQVKALGRQAAAAGALLECLDATGDAPGAAPPRHVPGVVGDPRALARARATRTRVAADRAQRRAARMRRVTARWRSHGLVG